MPSKLGHDAASSSGGVASAAPALVLTVNVGTPRTVRVAGHDVDTAIWKHPVDGRVAATATGLRGDRQADPRVHGGVDRAIYAYAHEDTGWWALELDRPLGPGAFGENLTTTGLDVNNARIGEQWAIGRTVVEVAGPRIPCFKLGIRFDDAAMPRRFAAANRPGAYLRVITPGDVGAGDTITVLSRPTHDVTVALVARAFHDHDLTLVRRLLAAPQLPDDWRDWAMRRLAATQPHGRARAG